MIDELIKQLNQILLYENIGKCRRVINQYKELGLENTEHDIEHKDMLFAYEEQLKELK